MKKLLMFAILGIFVLGAVANATETRVMTMGDANRIVKDEANVMMFPQTITLYPKLLGAKICDGDFEQLYGHMQFSEASNPMALGFYFFNYNDDLPYMAPGELSGLDYNRLNVVFGTNMGENMVGAALEYDQASRKWEGDDNDTEYGFFRLGFTAGVTMMEDKLDVAGKIRMSSWTDIGADGEDNSEPSGNLMFALYGRYWMDPMGKWTLVPHFGFDASTEGAKAPESDDKMTRSEFNFDMGLGLNYDAAQDILMITDAGFNFRSRTDKTEIEGFDDVEDKEGWVVLPYIHHGLDAKVFKWLDFRAGVVTEWEMYTNEPEDGDKQTWNEVDTDFYLGAGFIWGNFMIDTELNPSFLNEGPDFIGGSEYDKASGDLFWTADLIYWLD